MDRASATRSSRDRRRSRPAPSRTRATVSSSRLAEVGAGVAGGRMPNVLGGAATDVIGYLLEPIPGAVAGPNTGPYTIGKTSAAHQDRIRLPYRGPTDGSNADPSAARYARRHSRERHSRPAAHRSGA